MSKKSKGQKLDTSLLFQTSSTAVPDASTVPDFPSSRPRYDINSNDSSRDQNTRSRFGGDSEINWRKPSSMAMAGTGGSSMMMAGSKTGDKWESAFSKGSKATPSWKKPDDSSREGSRHGADKWQSSSLADRETSRPNASAGDNSLDIGKTTSIEQPKITPLVSQVPKSDQEATNDTKGTSKQKENLKKVKQDAAKKLKEIKNSLQAKAMQLRMEAENREIATYDQAVSVIASGHKGTALVNYLKSLEAAPSGSALFKAVVRNVPDIPTAEWISLAEFGSALKFALRGDSYGQLLSLYHIQAYCFEQHFPKVKDSKKNLIEFLMEQLFKVDIIDIKSFISWSEDDQEVEGKQTALIQTTTFFQILNATSESEGEEEDDGDIDSPLPTVP